MEHNFLSVHVPVVPAVAALLFGGPKDPRFVRQKAIVILYTFVVTSGNQFVGVCSVETMGGGAAKLVSQPYLLQRPAQPLPALSLSRVWGGTSHGLEAPTELSTTSRR